MSGMNEDRYKGIRIKNSSLEELVAFRQQMEKDDVLLERVKKDPISELKTLGVEIDPNSEVGKRLISCASNLSKKTLQSNVAPRCYVVPSGEDECWYVSLPF